MTAKCDPFVLFAQARSGSSNLLRVLQLHPQLHVAEEPFQQKFPLWNPGEPNYLARIVDVRSMEEQLSVLFSKYDGIKVLDYELPKDIYSYMLLRPDIKVIALRRHNLLQQAVSGFIAKQTGIWKMWDLKGDLATAYRGLQPIDLDALEENLEYRQELNQHYADILSLKPARMCLQFVYEELFTSDVAQNRAAVRNIFLFLGLSMPEGEELNNLIDPKVSKINNAGTYEMLPNVRIIDEQFGSDETGWLFEKDVTADYADDTECN